MKKLFILVFLLIILSVFIILNNGKEKVSFDYQHTKAICSGNSCQDFLITCNDHYVIEMKPLTGNVVFSNDWQDPRNEEEKELC